jgi:hypothetical protein
MAFWSKVVQSFPLTSAKVAQLIQDAAGNARSLAYNESNSGGSQYVAISTATTTTVSGTPSRLCCIHVVGTGGTLGAITIYDAATATGSPIFSQAAPLGGDIYDLQLPLQTGLTIVTAAATTLLVTYE